MGHGSYGPCMRHRQRYRSCGQLIDKDGDLDVDFILAWWLAIQVTPLLISYEIVGSTVLPGWGYDP